jgi:hypothetical protein
MESLKLCSCHPAVLQCQLISCPRRLKMSASGKIFWTILGNAADRFRQPLAVGVD